MIELTEQQQRALDGDPRPPRVVDPRNNTLYVLVRADLYERVGQLLGEDWHPSEAYPAVDRAFSAGWDDPKMDDYDRYEELKR